MGKGEAAQGRNMTGNGAEVIVKALHHAGVQVLFANPGTTEMHIVGALDTSGVQMKSVLCLHETVCTGAADGYGRMMRKPAATLLHLGVGLANGVANLHNAKRSRAPIINLVGEMSTWIKGFDPVLNMDIELLAKTVSGWVHTPKEAKKLAAHVAEAVQASLNPGDPMQSRIATLIVPHDLAFAEDVQSTMEIVAPVKPPMDGAMRFIKACAEALTSTNYKRKAVYVAGAATLSTEENFITIGKVASAVGAKLLCENNFARLDRGVGLPHASRLPYFPNDAKRELSKYDLVVCIDARRPVAMFGYESGPTDLISLDDDNIWDIDSAIHLNAALQMLGKEVGSERIQPGVNCGGLFVCRESRPKVPAGSKLSPNAMCAIIARHQPADAIVVDESLTSGSDYFELSKGCPSFTHMTITGGAIGCGPPMAVGAAVACPYRQVINIQADGSGLYSVQALWTQAREYLNVVTVVCSNRKYNILNLELGKQRVKSSNHAANLTSLSNPPIEWRSLAEGFGVPSTRASTPSELEEALSKALNTKGPYLIEAVL